jgi:hypothetical protein
MACTSSGAPSLAKLVELPLVPAILIVSFRPVSLMALNSLGPDREALIRSRCFVTATAKTSEPSVRIAVHF